MKIRGQKVILLANKAIWPALRKLEAASSGERNKTAPVVLSSVIGKSLISYLHMIRFTGAIWLAQRGKMSK